MLKWRLLSAAVILSVLFGLLHLDFHHPLGVPGIWLFPLIIVVVLLIAGELLDFWRDRADCPVRWSVYAGTLVTIAATSIPMFQPLLRASNSARHPLEMLGWTCLGFVLALGIVIVGEMARYSGPGKATSSIALGLLAVAYAGLLPGFLVQLRLFRSSNWGMGALVSLILIVKASDTGAYFTGRLLGRHKLAPRLSPGKTVEGTIGGLAAAIAAAWFCYFWLLPRLMQCDLPSGQLWQWTVYAAALMAVGVVGDLAESMFKRDADRKDSSRWLPGLGGVLDIVDSILLTAPIAFFCWALGLIGP